MSSASSLTDAWRLKDAKRLKVLFITPWYPKGDRPDGMFVQELAKAVQIYDDVAVLHLAGKGQAMTDTAPHHPLLRRHAHIRKALVVVVTANRGLCGGYNTNILRSAVARIEAYKKQGVEVTTHLIGKKAISFFNFQKLPYAASFTNVDDKMTFADSQKFAESYMESFSLEAVDKIDIIYTKYFSAAVQKPVVETVLPVEIPEEEKGAKTLPFLFEPDPQTILLSLLPKAISINIYQSLLDAVASEQIARRIAMKSATDAASDMIKSLTLQYNRIRQAKITQEIAEIVGGAAAIQ